MKKTLLVSAVALAVSGSAFAEGSSYGNMRLGLQNTSELDVVSGKLVIGYKGSEDLGNGMSLGYGVELENDSADAEKTGWSNDKSWVSLGGDFGKVIIGEHSDMAGWACGATDILYYGTAEACSLGHNTSPANAIQYRGGAGAVEFGVAMTFDGTGESSTLLGFSFGGDNFQVGAQMVSAGDALANGDTEFGSVPLGESGYAIGGSYSMGDIVFGLTLGDDGTAADSGGVDLAVSLPVGAGSLSLVVSTMDAANSDSTDLLYDVSLGKNGYTGVEFNSSDGAVDDTITAYIGTKF